MSVYVKDIDPELVEEGRLLTEKLLYLSDALCHYGVKGMKWGVRRTPEELGHLRISIDKSGKMHTIRTTVAGHNDTPRRATPYAVIDHVGKSGKVDKRSYYDKNGWKALDIHTDDHGHPKHHSYGKHHEHAHEYTWHSDGRPNLRTIRELLARERKENEDIL